MTPGAFVISLDFELFWGMRDKRTLEEYGRRILGVRAALPRMLDTFDAHGVKATFATVGLLFFDTKAELLGGLPEERPSYSNARLSPFVGHLDTIGNNEQEDPYHFGASLIRRIQERSMHELACHTFSHYYCLENGQTPDQFESDLLAAKRAAAPFGIHLRSFVFPRNQYNAAYLEICRRHGITAYRGNERSWLYQARSRQQETYFRRGIRLLDAWLNLSGPNCHAFPTTTENLPVDIPSSRFLRPWSARWRVLDGLRLRRITQAMDHAARTGTVFHLWWHPHNFGQDLDRNMAFLEQVLKHYDTLHTTYGFRSMTMGEIANEGIAS